MFSLLLAFAMAVSSAPPRATDDPLRDCYARIELGVADGHRCVMRQTSETGRTLEAITWLRARVAERPDDAADRVTLGRLLARLRDPEAATQLASAIETAARTSDPHAEVMGRLSYVRVQADEASADETQAQFDEALAVANAQADPFLAIEVCIARASLHRLQAAHLGQAEATLREVHERFGEPRHVAQAIRFHSVWAAIAVSTGRLETAVHRYRRAAALAREHDELRTLARLRYNEAVALRRLERERGRSDDGQHQHALEAVIQTGLRVQDTELVAMARAMLGSTAPPPRAVPALERCLESLPDNSPYRTGCLRALAWYRALEDLTQAEAMIDEALVLSQQPSQMVELAESLALWADVLWSRGDGFAAIAEGLATVEIVETMRGMQDDAVSRARISAAWSLAYYETAGRALELTHGNPQGATFALGMMERLRARAIRDALAHDDAPAPAEPPAPLRPDDAFFEQLSQRRADLHARADTVISDLSKEDTPSVREVQAHLLPNEALLSFQLDDHTAFETAQGRDGGGSWVTAITRDTVAVHALRDGSDLDAMMQTYLGLFRGDPSMLIPSGYALHRAVLGEALDSLPAHVDQLIIIPDGRMHRLPFAALSIDPHGTPLVQSHAISTVPSAALWLAWRDAGAVPVDRDAHLFADPPPPEATSASTQLPALPRARVEVQRIAAQLGARARVYTGAAASEARLLDTALDGGLLHLATHAVIDPDDPERSVLIVAADPSHDGLAQVREIASTPRPDAVVVLAACRGADGLVLRGEGLMGLARGFLQAQARTVVASLWPLSDEQAAPFFEAFYARLARGETTADALANTQRAWIDAGQPHPTWAGMVVLGDGASRPFSNANRMPVPRWIGFPILIAGLAMLGFGVRRGASRARRKPLV